MREKPTTTTPDPEYAVPLEHMEEGVPDVLGGENLRGETAGCPTGLAGSLQSQQPQQPGGGGAPGTGDTAPDFAPGEGISEKKRRAVGRKT